jgi:hypothetical protein
MKVSEMPWETGYNWVTEDREIGFSPRGEVGRHDVLHVPIQYCTAQHAEPQAEGKAC